MRVSYGAWARAVGRSREDRRRRYRLVERRSRNSGACRLLLSLRILRNGSAQRLLEYPLLQHAGGTRVFPRVRESARGQRDRAAAGDELRPRHAVRAARDRAALDEIRGSAAWRHGARVWRRTDRVADARGTEDVGRRAYMGRGAGGASTRAGAQDGR